MRKIYLLLFLISCFAFGQKKKYYGREITSNIEARATLMKPFGNNFLAKDHQMFYGFGFGGNMMTPINFGLGIDYNVLFSNIKYGHENIAGNISGPVLTNIEFYLVHRNVFSEEFTLEEFGGASSYVLSTAYDEAISERHKDKGVGFHFGLKPIYTLDRRISTGFCFRKSKFLLLGCVQQRCCNAEIFQPFDVFKFEYWLPLSVLKIFLKRIIIDTF
ncbi:hypothetical protein [uncultured Chryseobacterium sp.]|uniref:hypothetical protein n=1 Tax=uncultured Chryseobacterium sp. TaxID=259322 RepID=UPI00261CEE28|nr:hypothetical protein [uncultured Chryseobacterium sp.]